MDQFIHLMNYELISQLFYHEWFTNSKYISLLSAMALFAILNISSNKITAGASNCNKEIRFETSSSSRMYSLFMNY